MDTNNVNELLTDVKSIDNETNYWLVRTMGGDYYDDYVNRNFIAIGYNEITIDDIKHLPEKDAMAKTALQEMLKARAEYIKRVSYPASQMLRFAREMKAGDIVVVPASSSYKVTFGILENDIYEETANIHGANDCPFSKRRKVKWLKTSMRHSLPAELQLMFNSRHIVSGVNGYASYIDNFLNDFYTKGDLTYLVLRVKQRDILSADDFTLVSDLMELFNAYSEENNLGLTSQDIKMKMSVQSPGDILAFAQSWEGVTVLGLLIMFIKGGNLSANYKDFHLGISVPTIGSTFIKVVNTFNTFLNDRQKRITIEKLNKKLENMDIETPQAIVDMITKLGLPSGTPQIIEENEEEEN